MMLALALALACSRATPQPGPQPAYTSAIARAAALGEASPAWIYDPSGFKVLGTPEPGDWLDSFPEPGQTVADFLEGPRPTIEGPLLLVPIALDADLRPHAEVVGAWLGVEVIVAELGIEIADLPGRIHPDTGARQLYTPQLLQRLHDARPGDALGVLGVTAIDIAPDASWSFVFGQATYTERVGIFSTARQRPVGTSGAQALRRSVQTLVHEALHMFGAHHCPYYACAMNGSNGLEESDRTPVALCPVCLRKLVGATGLDPVARYEALAQAYRRHGLLAEAAFVEERLQAAPR